MYGMLGILGCNVSCDCKGLQMGCIPDDRTHASKVKQRWLLGPMFPRAGKKREPLSAREGDDSSQHPHVGELSREEQTSRTGHELGTGDNESTNRQHIERVQSQLVLQNCTGTS